MCWNHCLPMRILPKKRKCQSARIPHGDPLWSWDRKYIRTRGTNRRPTRVCGRDTRTAIWRKSAVADPIRRGNTGNNTPAVIHYNIVPGDRLRITAMPKGFGSENMGGVKMLKPSQGVEGVIQFVLDTVKEAGPNPCPPTVIGVGIGGTMEKAALLSKQALARDLRTSNPDPYYAALEEELLEKINQLDVGAGGFGGKATSLGVNIETYPTHIAGLPVAVTVSCHVTETLPM